MLLPHGTVVAVVDGRNFALFQNTGNETAPELSSLETPALHETNKGSGARHISSAANPDDGQIDEDSHAAAVTDWLGRQVSERKISDLIIVAAPRTLGEMRRHYSKALKEKLVGEVDKDLIGRSAREITEALHV